MSLYYKIDRKNLSNALSELAKYEGITAVMTKVDHFKMNFDIPGSTSFLTCYVVHLQYS